jgi:hypothetical protein
MDRTPEDADFYVATQGNDEWSGRLAAPTDDESDGPFASLARARDAVRATRTAGRRGDARVLIRGGRYELAETVVFGIADGAGETTDTITYAAYPGEEPVFSGARRITGWRELEDWDLPLPIEAKAKVWVADVPTEFDRFFTLYQGDRRLTRARSEGFAPTAPALLPEELWAMTGTALGDREDLLTTLAFPPGALQEWPNLEDVELVIRPNYPTVINFLGLASVDLATGIARTTLPGTYPLRPLSNRFNRSGNLTKSAWIENVLEALDRPGAWVLNTRERKLYLWPLDDEPGSDICAPLLRELVRVEGTIDIEGSIDEPVRGIVFEGLGFTQGDRDVWLVDDASIQHDFEMADKPNALVRLRGAERCGIIACRFFNSGGTGIRLDLYCQDNRVEQNELSHLGSTGIALIGYGPGTKDVNRHNRVIDNHIHHCGEIYWHAIGIVIANSGANTVAHNYLHHLPRGAIGIYDSRPHFFDRSLPMRRECARMIRWQEVGDVRTWEQAVPFLHTCNNVIEYNEITRTNLFGGDSASVNLSGAGEGNIIRRNWIHDIPNPNIHGAIRTDDFQSGTRIEENVVYRTNSGGLMIRLRNQWLNNVVVDVDPKNYVWFGQQPLDGTTMRGNIFFNPGPEAPGFGIMWRPAGMNPFDRLAAASGTDVGHNIFYSAASDAARETLAEFTRRGLDNGSAVVDPGFTDWQHADFRLTPESAARRMGVPSIDIHEAGLTASFPDRLRG